MGNRYLLLILLALWFMFLIKTRKEGFISTPGNNLMSFYRKTHRNIRLKGWNLFSNLSSTAGHIKRNYIW